MGSRVLLDPTGTGGMSKEQVGAVAAAVGGYEAAGDYVARPRPVVALVVVTATVKSWSGVDATVPSRVFSGGKVTPGESLA